MADLEVDLAQHQATREGKPIDLTARDFLLLSLLVERSGEVVSKIQIAERIGKIDYEKFPKTMKAIDAYMAQLRIRVDGPFEKKLIQSIQGMGYFIRTPGK